MYCRAVTKHTVCLLLFRRMLQHIASHALLIAKKLLTNQTSRAETHLNGQACNWSLVYVSGLSYPYKHGPALTSQGLRGVML